MSSRWFAFAALAFVGCDNEGSAIVAMDPMTIPKFVEPLVIPRQIPSVGSGAAGTEYRIAVRQFRQQMLPSSMPDTLVFGYGTPDDPSTFSYPGPTVEARSGSPIRVTWINELVDDSGRFLPHLLPVDQSIHWAAPGGHDHGAIREPYRGPVPIVTHVHGAHSFDHSDGYPEAWMLPAAVDIPDGFERRGPYYQTQADVPEGAAVFDYPLDESAATLWYHDHTLGMTRTNVYAGLAGFWLVRDDVDDGLGLPGPAPRVGDPDGTRYYEIPLAIQDKSFGTDGSLFYPSKREQYDQYTGPVAPDSDVPPIWGPEFIGNAMVVNGRTWPYLEVEPRLYRFRVLNASEARTLFLSFDRAGIEFIQIGGDGGFRPDAPLRTSELRAGPAERFDVLVDFSSLAPGDTVTMLNTGPDDPWGGPDANPAQPPADPSTTGQVMQFRVVAATANGTAGAVPTTLPAAVSLTPTAETTRDLTLSEMDTPDNFPTMVMLGTVADGPLEWAAPATEVIRNGDTEIWRVANTTDDAHPIHLHLIDFQVLDRTPFDVDAFTAAQEAAFANAGPAVKLDDYLTGAPAAATGTDLGPKDTVLMLPGTVTRIIARFDRAGRYVWHCHIIEHEDNDMMRPMVIQ